MNVQEFTTNDFVHDESVYSFYQGMKISVTQMERHQKIILKVYSARQKTSVATLMNLRKILLTGLANIT